jgi:hypothetical protein
MKADSKLFAFSRVTILKICPVKKPMSITAKSKYAQHQLQIHDSLTAAMFLRHFNEIGM